MNEDDGDHLCFAHGDDADDDHVNDDDDDDDDSDGDDDDVIWCLHDILKLYTDM